MYLNNFKQAINPVFFLSSVTMFFLIVVGFICGKVCSYIVHKPEDDPEECTCSTSIRKGSILTYQERRHSTAKSLGLRRTSRRIDSFEIGFDDWV